MTINQSNVIFVYNSEDPNGVYFANRYANIHNLSQDQLVGIDTDTEEIVDSYREFKDQLEDPLRNRILQLKESGRDVFAIVLGWRIPAGFYHDGKIISSVSRIAAIAPIEEEQPLELNKRNPLFNRGIFKRYDKEDSSLAFIVTQLDAPLRQIMDRKFDDISSASSSIKVDGSFYFDLYAGYGDGERATSYQNRLNLFNDTTMKRLSINIEKTVQIDEFNDVFFGQLRDDSIFWGWGVDILYSSYFYPKSTNRAFFYNGDFISLKSFRSFNVSYPGVMAISSGYLAVAGAMDEINRTDEVVIILSPHDPYASYDPYDPYDPYGFEEGYIGVPTESVAVESSIDPYSSDPYETMDLIDPLDPSIPELDEGSFDILLDPVPFFDSTMRGAPVGEAFLFSNPFLNNSMTLFADPLMIIDVSSVDQEIDKINIFDSFKTISENYAKSYSHMSRRAALSYSLIQRVVDSCEIDYPTTLLTPTTEVYSTFSYDKIFSEMTTFGQKCRAWIVDASFNLLPPKEPTFFEYLFFANTEISEMFLIGTGDYQKIQESLPPRFIFDEGSWMFETVIEEMHPFLYFLIQFELIVSLDPEFNDIIFNIESIENLSSWEYEEPYGHFTPLTYEGVPSNLKGRRVRYRSDEFKYFTRFTKLYIKYRQVGDAFFYLPYSSHEDIVSH